MKLKVKIKSGGGAGLTCNSNLMKIGGGIIFEITVSDTGIGVPEKNRALIFTLFGSDSKKMENFNTLGAGLGLTIS